LAKGGYRLANTLIDIFAKQEEQETNFLQEWMTTENHDY
jgi:hypothetical protein